MANWFRDRIAPALAERHAQQLYRARANQTAAQGRIIEKNGREFLNFCSNDYLGLAAHTAVKQAFMDAAHRYGVGAGASHLVNGHHQLHSELEETVARWLGRDRALLFGSGYLANVGVVSALCQQGDSVFQDKLNHASLLDGGLLSGARLMRYLHNDMVNLQQKLQRVDHDKLSLIATDSVFSMDGDIAPLPELAKLAAQYGALLMADDAHAVGVLGASGAGSVEHFSLDQTQLPLVVITLGKALGTYGAIVAGSSELMDYLVQFARPYIYTTALPPAVAAATLQSIHLCRTDSDRRARLHDNIRYFRAGAQQLTLPHIHSHTAIQAIMCGSNENALRLSAALEAAGIWASAIRPPTVPANTARIRITLTALHTHSDIDRLLECLAQHTA